MSDIPVPKVFLQVMCDCGHDMFVNGAEDPGDGITTFNFEGVCSNVVEVCHHQAWTASVTISEVALQADAASRHKAQRERDASLRAPVADKKEVARPPAVDEKACNHPVGNGSCVLPEGHEGAHRLTLPEPEEARR